MSTRLAAYQRYSAIPVAVATLCVVPALALEGSTTPELIRVSYALNWASWAILAAHVAATLLLAGMRPGLRLIWLDLILVVVSVPVAPSALGAARLLRLLRVVRLGVATAASMRRMRAALQHRQFHFVALVAVVAVCLGGIGIYSIEGGENRHIQSVGDGLWWAIVTATTVGYGDISPTTTEGRIIAVVLMILGIGVIGAFTATIASFFVQQDEGSELQAIEARLDRLERKIDALLAESGSAGPPAPSA